MKSNKLAACFPAAFDVGGDCGSVAMSPGPMQMSCFDLHRAMRLPEVLRITGLSRSAWYALLNPKLPTYDSEAPQPFKLGNSRRSPSAWWAWQVLAYLQAKSIATHAHGGGKQ